MRNALSFLIPIVLGGCSAPSQVGSVYCKLVEPSGTGVVGHMIKIIKDSKGVYTLQESPIKTKKASNIELLRHYIVENEAGKVARIEKDRQWLWQKKPQFKLSAKDFSEKYSDYSTEACKKAKKQKMKDLELSNKLQENLKSHSYYLKPGVVLGDEYKNYRQKAFRMKLEDNAFKIVFGKRKITIPPTDNRPSFDQLSKKLRVIKEEFPLQENLYLQWSDEINVSTNMRILETIVFSGFPRANGSTLSNGYRAQRLPPPIKKKRKDKQ